MIATAARLRSKLRCAVVVLPLKSYRSGNHRFNANCIVRTICLGQNVPTFYVSGATIAPNVAFGPQSRIAHPFAS